MHTLVLCWFIHTQLPIPINQYYTQTYASGCSRSLSPPWVVYLWDIVAMLLRVLHAPPMCQLFLRCQYSDTRRCVKLLFLAHLYRVTASRRMALHPQWCQHFCTTYQICFRLWRTLIHRSLAASVVISNFHRRDQIFLIMTKFANITVVMLEFLQKTSDVSDCEVLEPRPCC